jgi:hypothetical protein
MVKPLDDAAVGDDVVVDAPVPADARPDAGPLDAAPVVPMLIQQASNATNDVTTISTTLPALPANGRVLVMIGASISGELITVSGAGATWVRATNSLDNTNIEVWYGVTNGTNATVTITRPNDPSTMYLVVTEWSGLATANTLDGARSMSGSAATISAGSITTTSPHDLVVFAATALPPNTWGTPMPGTWAAMPGITSQFITQAEWSREVTSAGLQTAGVTHTGGVWEAAIVAFRVAD